jgi:anaerobic dimethyl sulfoxide reductase subunit A
MSVKKLPVSCNKDCGGGCPLLAYVENGRLLKITNNPLKTPYMAGCVRGYQMPKVVYAPDRLKRPLVREGERGSGAFREISWRAALDLVAERLQGISAKHGKGSILPLGGSGSCIGAVHNTAFLKERFFELFGGYTVADGNYSEQAVQFTSAYLFGPAHTGLDPGSLQYSRLVILWGANIVDNRFGCEMEARIRQARRRGARIVVIDPRRSRTAVRLSTQWIPVHPGTDSALMAGVLHCLLTEGLVDRDAVRKLGAGFEGLERYILGGGDSTAKTPEWASGYCGTPARTIRSFSRLYGKTHPAALIPGLSIQRTIGGEETTRMAVALQLATGNIGIPGGSSGGNVLNKLPVPRCPTIRLTRPHQGPSIAVYRWPDAVLEGAGGGFPCDIHVLYTVGGNYLSQGSDVRKNIRAFQKAEFSVCHEYFLTPTARFSDVVFPVTTFLEREDILFPRSNHLFYSHRAIHPLHEARNDYDIFTDLAERMGFAAEFTENRTASQWLEYLLERSEVKDLENFRKSGIHAGEEQARTGLSDFARDPVLHPLRTPSGRIQIDFSPYGETGFTPFPVCRMLDTSVAHPLRLITPHARYRTHSQYHNIPWFRDRQDDSLWMNPVDAGTRGIHDGQTVVVRSACGSMKIRARVTADITCGVVSACQGVWPVFDSDGTETAGSVNVLTPTDPTEPSKGSRTHSVLVQVVGQPSV